MSVSELLEYEALILKLITWHIKIFTNSNIFNIMSRNNKKVTFIIIWNNCQWMEVIFTLLRVLIMKFNYDITAKFFYKIKCQSGIESFGHKKTSY